jgi:plastocyanin
LPRKLRRTLAVLPAVAAVVLLVGCSEPVDTATAPPAITFAPDAGTTPGMSGMSGMPAPAPVSAAPVSGALAGQSPAPKDTNSVDVGNFAFAPATLTVPLGSTVTWTNRDEEPHTVVASGGAFHSPGMGAGGTYSFTFDTAGTFDYVCSIHPFMHGAVVVTK